MVPALPPLGRLFDALALRLVELPQIGDDPLPRAALGAVRLHQCPIGVAFAVLGAITRANEHARILSLPQGRSGGQGLHYNALTTRRGTGPARVTTSCAEKPHLHPGTEYDKILTNLSSVGEVGLDNSFGPQDR